MMNVTASYKYTSDKPDEKIEHTISVPLETSQSTHTFLSNLEIATEKLRVECNQYLTRLIESSQNEMNQVDHVEEEEEEEEEENTDFLMVGQPIPSKTEKRQEHMTLSPKNTEETNIKRPKLDQ
jgi:hypothetical protein